MRRTPALLAAAGACVAAGGWLLAVTWHVSYGHGLFCAIGTATTVGCDAQPAGTAGRIAAAAVMLTTIPLIGVVFARLTAQHAAGRLSARLAAAEKRIATEADHRHVLMQRHVESLLRSHVADLKQHISPVADGPARGGAGSNPAKSEGLPAETVIQARPVVPPPATTSGGI